MNSLAENGDLFSKKYCVVVNQIFDNVYWKRCVFKVDLFKSPKYVYIFAENDLTTTRKRLEKSCRRDKPAQEKI